MTTSQAYMAAKPLSIDAIVAKAESPINNITLLSKGFSRFAQILSKDILSIASTAPSFTYEGYYRTETLLVREIEENSCLSELLVCEELKQHLQVTVDRTFVFGLCNVVFGGVGNEPPFAEMRPFSKIERAIAQLFFKTVGRSLPSAFTNIALKEFSVAPPQDPNEDPVYAPFKPFVSVKILCNIHSYSGELLIELSEELAARFRPVDDGQRAIMEPNVSGWGEQISERVESIDVELVAVLTEFQMSLDGITSLYAGQVIKLDSDISSPLVVCSEGIKLFSAKLGQTDRKFCLSIQVPITMTQ